MALFGQDQVFYDLLEKQADAAHRAAEAFAALANDFHQSEQYARDLKAIESEADDIRHTLVNTANSRFVTPLDKEDIFHLSASLDNIIDTLEAAGARVTLYRLTEVRPDLLLLANVVVRVTEATRSAVGILRHLKDHEALDKIFVTIHSLENESDQLYRQALGDLFNQAQPDPVMIMKWKEIYDRMEVTVDECEDVADILESLVVKYA